jgi:S-adenosylmethionine-diacylglycerol 3-amino-3-carboxypropyl transferase
MTRTIAKLFLPNLRRETYDVIRARTDRVTVHHASLIDFLKEQSLRRFVLLDAQDWMTPEILAQLWLQIDRVADSRDARVIFRTAGTDSPLPRKLPAALLAPWQYRAEESSALHMRNRSSIYGGFRLYARRALSWRR